MVIGQTPVALDITETTTIIGIYFDCGGQDRREFVREQISAVRRLASKRGLDVDSPNFAVLAVSLDACGGQATYRTFDDIPLVDVPCPCGNPNHWLIKYKEE